MCRKNTYASLDDAMQRFYAACEQCRQKIIVHAWGNKTHKRKETIYGHCETAGCKHQMIEVAFNIGK